VSWVKLDLENAGHLAENAQPGRRLVGIHDVIPFRHALTLSHRSRFSISGVESRYIDRHL